MQSYTRLLLPVYINIVYNPIIVRITRDGSAIHLIIHRATLDVTITGGAMQNRRRTRYAGL